MYKIHFNNSVKDISYIASIFKEAEASGSKGLTLLLGESYLSDLSMLDTLLKSQNLLISGGIFPEIIYNSEYHSDGVVIIEWSSEIKVATFFDISNTDSELYQPASFEEELNDDCGCLVFVDSSACSSENALDALYYRSENDYQYAGAGAGHIKNPGAPCILSNQGLMKDALQTVKLSMNQTNHACNGWSILSGPHLVTASDKKRVSALDYKPVKEQYRTYIQQKINEDISHLSINELIKIYPVGIYHYGEDMIVRDADKYADDAIEFFGEISEFSNIYILNAKPEQLVLDVKSNLQAFDNGDKYMLSILFSCVGRRRYMGEHSNTELTIINEKLSGKNPLIGTSSIGEIASNPAGIVRFHTMSLVISRFS